MTAHTRSDCSIPYIFFDFGGVLAEEGFYQGLHVIARENGLDPAWFVPLAVETILKTGYVLGKGTESEYWSALRQQTGVDWSDDQLRETILNHFVPRPAMLQLLSVLAEDPVHLGLLSDQTDWLDELDARYGLYTFFDSVNNSYVTGLHKGQPACFELALKTVRAEAKDCLFIDDNPNNIRVAREVGLETILFRDLSGFAADFRRYCPQAVQSVFS
ncbi:HAD family hydrolase [Desulfohalobium retbaense]|uniref:HAD-superfamily hydrolase, subfamily IA, variant 3 n=1 Tax=Desulfohalobium retbaense (strain ATCC 49708 / DSM 5692 / JCM 16813 / HR100) TaxID=485915 RepID=C8X1Y8_DESRD|nr:HAD-superfamily hydrolase, subfamily IA, variant 3 [Desulfohalobium retbaense DSM 5692]